MTEEQKDILIAKMLDAPDSLTDKELDLILHDDEMKDIYETSANVSGVYRSTQEYDLEHEWSLFRHRILPKPSFMKRFMRVAAIFLGVVLTCGIVAKVIDNTLTRGHEEQIAETAKPAHKTQGIKGNTQKTPCMVASPIEKSVTETANQATHTATKEVMQPSPKEKEEEIDVEEYLRQQQEEIEDAIIRQKAEIYVDEYYAMKEFISGMNDENIIITE